MKLIKIKIIRPLALLIVSLFLPLLFSTSALIASPEKSFYVSPGLTLFAEENENVESFIEATVGLRADPALVPSGRVDFSGLKIPVLAAELGYDDFDGAAIILGWRFAEHFSLEMKIAEPANLEVSFDLPAQTIDLANSFSNAALESIGNTDPGNVSAPAILGRLVDFDILELAVGSNYRFSVSDTYQLYLGVGIIGFKEIDSEINSLSGVNTDSLKAEFESDLDFYFQAGFDYQITERISLTLDIKQVSSDSTITVKNIVLSSNGVDNFVSTGDIKTEFDISGNLYYLGLRYIF